MDRTISWMIAGGDRGLSREERLQRWHRDAIAAADRRDREEPGAGRGPRLALPGWLAFGRRDAATGPALDCCAA
jgi:hypothetical protein